MPVDVTPFTSRAQGDTAGWDVPLDAVLIALAASANARETVLSAGNGTTDQTAQIQAAIDVVAATVMPGVKFQNSGGTFQGGLQANGGGTVQLGPGQFMVSNLVLKHRVALRGAHGTILRQIAASTGPVIANRRDSTAHAQYCSISDLTIDGNKAAQSAANHGILLQGDLTNNFTDPLDEDYDINCRVSNVYIYQCKGSGIYMSGAGDNRISDVKIRSCDGVGLYTFQDNHITNVDIGWSGLQGMWIDGESCMVDNVKCWRSGAVTAASGQGYLITADSGCYSSLFAQDNTAEGFYFNGANNVIAGSLSADSNSRGAPAAYAGFRVDNSNFCRITGQARNRYNAGAATGEQASALYLSAAGGANAGNGIDLRAGTGVWGTNAAALMKAGSAATTGNTVTINGTVI